MRYIGNKTNLLPFIEETIQTLGLGRGVAVDAFAGTASVASFLKSMGFEVHSTDLMTYSYVFQKAYVELDKELAFSELFKNNPHLRGFLEREGIDEIRFQRWGGIATNYWESLKSVILYLEEGVRPRKGFLSKNFAPDTLESKDEERRRYFTPQNAMRLDAWRSEIEDWRQQGWLQDLEYYLLLALVIEASDRVANTTGVYAAYLKKWQPNARKRVRLPEVNLVLGSSKNHQANQIDALKLVRQVDAELLYLDPPYNSRQYTGYYHVPELIARGWFDGEVDLRGKTGLIPDEHQRSEWARKAQCTEALERILYEAKAKHVLLSYNTEGIIPEKEIKRIFKTYGRQGSFQIFKKGYKRYRSDSDKEGRSYKTDKVQELLFYTRKI